MKVHCAYGSGVDTTEQLIYDGAAYSSTPRLLKGDGGGTVNLKSLEVSLMMK